MAQVVLFGLIGYPLGHSFSLQYFTEKFQREGFGELAARIGLAKQQISNSRAACLPHHPAFQHSGHAPFVSRPADCATLIESFIRD